MAGFVKFAHYLQELWVPRERLPNTRESGIYPNPVRDAFGLPEAPMLITRTLHKPTMALTELRCDAPNFGITKSIPKEDAYLIALQMRECPDHDLYFDGRLVTTRNFVAGVTSIYDLRRDPIADLRGPFHSLHFYLPQHVLDSLAYEARRPRIAELQYQPGTSIDDPIVRHLISSLIPAIANPGQANQVFVDHVALALSAHIANFYGKMRMRFQPVLGGLTPSQERRAKEVLRANLNGEVSLNRLAAECGLSARHFARAFKQSTGATPHGWLYKIRIERAKELLRDPSSPLAEIAQACGFADQSHFTRAFAATMGVPPGAWRRMQN